MRNNRGIDRDIGNTPRKFAALQAQLDELRSERRANATTVDGDFTVENGGTLTVADGGGIRIDGGTLEAVFIFLYAHFTPGHVKFGSAQPGSEYEATVSAAGIDSDVALAFTTPTNDVRIDHTTTGSSANAVLDATTKRLSRSTSSRRYKQDIEDHDLDPTTILKMRPRTWRDRGDVKGDPDCARRYIGFVAEELDDLGLTEFLEYDSDGRPDAIAYDRLSVAMLVVLRWLAGRLKGERARIDALETQVADQQAQIAELTAQVTALAARLPEGTP